MKEKIKCILVLSIFMGIFYVWGMLGALQWDKITVGQAFIRGIIACTYMTGAVIGYNKLEDK